jgi:hypothetical protein
VSHRLAAIEHSIRAQEERADDIRKRIETFTSRGDRAAFADEVRARSEPPTPQGDLTTFSDHNRRGTGNLAARAAPSEEHSDRAHRLMNSETVVIIGSGGHAKVVIELIQAEGKYQIAGCTGLGGEGFVLGDVPILGTDGALPGRVGERNKKSLHRNR